MKKSMNPLQLDLETHRYLERIQGAECDKFSYLKKRRKDEVAVDILKLGIPEYIKTHGLNIKI